MNKLLILFVIVLLGMPLHAQQLDPSVYQGLAFRNLCPARTGGRVTDVAIDPHNRSIRYVAVASGNLWKTVNAGTTWQPIFDRYGSFSIGTVVIDPHDSNVIWVGTGENNSQRSVSMGDGVYKSTDAGKSFQNMGLKRSEHIGKIVVDPRDPQVVYVAAQGPLWADGGDRGLYKTTDGGQHWQRVLHVSEQTGISDVVLDPRNPDVLYATAYQRRRHVGMLVAGGPEGGIYKSTDAGKSWRKLSTGLPKGDIGRIGIAISPMDSRVLYAIIAGDETGKGFYRSENRGERWQKMNDYMVVDAQYYMELFPDPHQFDKVYVVDVRIHVTEDGGKTFELLPENRKHVDSHEIEFDPRDPNYLLVGCDGGIYESWDKGTTWRLTDNLPITQFYRVGIDNAEPFYNVYGGTQDNSTLGGPSRTTYRRGIRNADWTYLLGGDGFQVRVDPQDPNIVYCMYQYAGIVRYDKRTGEKIDIQPQPAKDEPPLRWHWDAPLIISPHKAERLYFAANKLFRSDDRGNSWQAISGDLSRQLDRNRMPVMGRVWGIDAIFKNVWTSPLSTIVSLDESPLQEGLLYVGTDDGLIQVSEDGGQHWRKEERFPGVPAGTYVADLHASRHDPNVVFAVFNNHKNGDYQPYLLKSSDRGRSWTSISGKLAAPEFGWTLVQDPQKADLLFVGTEYGIHFSLDGGQNWNKFQQGLPTIAIRDLEIQARESDLVAASFGRGFYILDNYDPLRHISSQALAQPALLFPVKAPWLYQETNPDGGAVGHAFFTSPNPTYGAVFTCWLKEGRQTRKQERQAAEKKKVAAGEPVYYPSWDEYLAEHREAPPKLVFTISDSSGRVVRRLQAAASKGSQRVAWDLRYPEVHHNGGVNPGPYALPGTYTLRLDLVEDGVWEPLGQEQQFRVKALHASRDQARQQALSFYHQLMHLRAGIARVNELLQTATKEMQAIKAATLAVAGQGSDFYEEAHRIEQQLLDLEIMLNGNRLITQKMELIPPSISSRANRIATNWWNTTAGPTATQAESYAVAAAEFEALLKQFNELIAARIEPLQAQLEQQKLYVGDTPIKKMSW